MWEDGYKTGVVDGLGFAIQYCKQQSEESASAIKTCYDRDERSDLIADSDAFNRGASALQAVLERFKKKGML